MEFKHKSVLLKETIDNLNVKPDGIYVDGTLGGAGHASEVCKLLSATGRLIGIDQDDAAIQAASERLRDYQSSISANVTDCPGAMSFKHGFPLRDGPNGPVSRQPKPLAPVGFSALIEHVTSSRTVGKSDKVPAYGPAIIIG